MLLALDIEESERALAALTVQRDKRQIWWVGAGRQAPRCELDDQIDAIRKRLLEQSVALQSRLDSNSRKAT